MDSALETPSLIDPAFHAGDPYPTYREWRARTPIFRDEDAGLWIITRHADVVAISSDPERFCSQRGILPADLHRETSESLSIIYMDPPRHRAHRKLAQPTLSIRSVAPFEPWIRALTRDLLDALDPSSPTECVETLAVPLPIYVIAQLLGVPASDRDHFRVCSDAAIEAATQLTTENLALIGELHEYLTGVIEERRLQPRDDLISVLTHSRIDGAALDAHDLMMFCFTLLVAGNETTRNLLSAGTWALATHPDERRRLAADGSGIPLAVEEMLRWESPIVAFMRTATCDVELRGEKIRDGESVLMVYAAANRDEAVFGDDAERFVPTRRPNPHLALGIGEHYCLGANLARLEARIYFEELLSRHPDFELAGAPRHAHSNLVRGLIELPVAFA